MSGTALWLLQSAIVGVLRADATLLALIGDAERVMDHVPDNQSFPYILIGEAQEYDDDTFARDGFRTVSHLEVYSRANGFKEAAAVADRCIYLLHRAKPTLAGYQTLMINRKQLLLQRLSDGVTRRAFMVFEGLFKKAA